VPCPVHTTTYNLPTYLLSTKQLQPQTLLSDIGIYPQQAPNIFGSKARNQGRKETKKKEGPAVSGGVINITMDVLEAELGRLHREATLSKSVEDVNKILEQLCNARESIAAGKCTLGAQS
jgi:hypothetical protein